MEKMQPGIWTDGLSCQHGQLARSCNLCELESEVCDLKAKVDELRDALTVVWCSMSQVQRHEWDAKAIEHFDALVVTPNAKSEPTSGIAAKFGSTDGLCHTGEE